ncbi:winged helix-turn-helix transcriptional regulator [Streptomyces albidoflavus]|uniref:winged helix-turn-helix transcriptional regulator n=1 Tax=Streptomyces TaxID=1883 RepID=UPI0009A0CB78|nr:hypothetical protein C0R02_09495 [Streptomyces albidoflavus]
METRPAATEAPSRTAPTATSSRVRYALTEQGRALEPVMRSMWEWGTARRHEGH